jgi:O-antigen ligase
MVISGSRKALIFLIIPISIFYLLKEKTSTKKIKTLAILMVLLVIGWYCIFSISFLYNFVGVRIEAMLHVFGGNNKADASTSLRLSMVEWGIEWFKSKPWFGYGVNNYRVLFGYIDTAYGSTGVYAHNNYIELLVDLGIAGTSLYYSMYLYILIRSMRLFRKMDELQVLCFGLFVSLLINEYGVVTYHRKFFQLIILMIWYVICYLPKSSNKEQIKLQKTQLNS